MRHVARLVCVLVWLISGSLAGAKEATVRMYIGCYTGTGSVGIYLSEMDPEAGTMSAPVLAGETTNPSFLALHPTQPYLYAALEVGEFEGQKTGAVEAFAIDRETGKLTKLNRQSSTGPGPCFVSVDPSGRTVLVANYSGGNVAAFSIAADGSLKASTSRNVHAGSGPNVRRQKKAYAHSITPDPTGKFALSCDLGTDEVIVYKLDGAAGTIERASSIKLAPGAGPRHLAFSPSGKFVFVNGELDNTVTPMRWENGELTPLAPAPTLPADYHADSTTAEVAVHPNGKFVYCSNRGHDSIAVMSFNESTGVLTPVGHTATRGSTPRNFAIDPSGRFLVVANQTSGTLVSFKIDPATGLLTPTGSTVRVDSACCVKFVKP